MIIDIHTHIFPPSVKEKREDFFGENSFRLLYSDRKSKIITAEEIIDAMDENGIDKSVVFGFPWKEEKNYRMNNDYVIEAVKRFPDRLIGFACVVGGGFANVYDRIRVGSVTDFLHIDLGGVFRTGIFNVADMSVSFGMIMILWASFSQRKHKESSKS